MMYGTTFGRSLFETPSGRVEPDSDVHFGVLLIASTSEREGAPRDHVCSMIWPTSPLDHSRHSLRQALYRLRRLGMPISLKGARVEINGEDTYIDIRRLLLGEAGREELMAIGTQPFLPAYMPKLGPAYAVWLDELRDRADNVRRIALVEAIREARTHARFREIHTLARALLELDPFNETATLSLAEALVMDGSKVEALRMLEAYEQEVGTVADALRIPVRTLKRRVSESLDDALLPRKYEVTFVGREEEFRELRTMFVATRQGRGQCAVVTGEAGIGKTRITNELLRLAVLDGAMVVSYPCTSGDSLSPLSSLLTLTQALLSQPGALGCSQEHLQYLRKLHSPESSQSTVISGMGADIAYAQLVYALSELVAAITDEGPVVLFVDDAQRLHQTAWRIFTDIVDRLPGKSVLLLLATRHLPEWYSGLGINGSDGRARHVRLGPLDYAESRRYLSAWCEKNRVMLSEEDSHVFATTASGNPFYLGELAGHVGRGGDARQAPPSIRGLIELQYAATTREAQRVLLVISLLQTRASLARVTEVLGVTPSDFVGALEELEIAGLVKASGSVMRAKHDLVGDVTIGISTTGVVGFLRTRIAELLEAEAEREDSVDLLADSLTQWEYVGDSVKIFSVGMRLGQRFFNLGLGTDSHSAYERAAVHAQTDEERSNVTEGLIRSAFLSGNTPATVEHLQKWRSMKRPPSGPNESLEMRLLAAEVGIVTIDKPLDYRPLLEMVGEEAIPLSSRLRALAICAMTADQCYDAATVSEVRSKIGEFDENDEENIYGLVARLVAAVVFEPAPEVMKVAEQIVRVSRQHSDLRIKIMGPRWASSGLRRIGAAERRLELVTESSALAEKHKLTYHLYSCWEHSCSSYLQLNQFNEAAEVLQKLESGCPPGTVLYAAYCLTNRAVLAYSTRDETMAIELMPHLPERSPFAATASHHAWVASRVALKLVADPGSVEDVEIDQLIAFQPLGNAVGGQDDRVAILVEALCSKQRVERAREVVEHYRASTRSNLGTVERLERILSNAEELTTLQTSPRAET